MMKNLILLVFVFLAMSTTAQRRSRNLNAPPEVVDPPRTGHGIGAILSTTNGNGLAYRYWPKKIGIHLAMFPYSSNSSQVFAVGSSLYYTLREYHGSNKFFLHFGMEYLTVSQENSNVIIGTDSHMDRSTFKFGLGPGLESHTRYGSFSGYLGYGIYNDFYRNGGTDEVRIGLTGGLSYFFEL